MVIEAIEISVNLRFLFCALKTWAIFCCNSENFQNTCMLSNYQSAFMFYNLFAWAHWCTLQFFYKKSFKVYPFSNPDSFIILIVLKVFFPTYSSDQGNNKFSDKSNRIL